MARVCPDAEPSGDLPHLDGLVSRGRQHVVAGRQERHRTHVVVMTMHSLTNTIRQTLIY